MRPAWLIRAAEAAEQQLRGELVRTDRWLLVAVVDGMVAGYGRVTEHRPNSGFFAMLHRITTGSPHVVRAGVVGSADE